PSLGEGVDHLLPLVEIRLCRRRRGGDRPGEGAGNLRQQRHLRGSSTFLLWMVVLCRQQPRYPQRRDDHGCSEQLMAAPNAAGSFQPMHWVPPYQRYRCRVPSGSPTPDGDERIAGSCSSLPERWVTVNVSRGGIGAEPGKPRSRIRRSPVRRRSDQRRVGTGSDSPPSLPSSSCAV